MNDETISVFTAARILFRFALALPKIARFAWRIVLWNGPTRNEDEIEKLSKSPLFRRDYEEIDRFIFGKDYERLVRERQRDER